MEKPGETAPPNPVARPALTHAERTFVRINVAQTVLALAGLFTGAVALYAALTESEAVRRQSAAAVWPYVQLLTWDSIDPGAEEFRISMTNSGVGPARIESVRVTLERRTAVSWSEALSRLAENRSPRFGQNAVVGRVLRPGETVDLMTTTDPEIVHRLHAIVVDDAGSIEYCYCSIFDECWLANISRQITRPESVRSCPDFRAESFTN